MPGAAHLALEMEPAARVPRIEEHRDALLQYARESLGVVGVGDGRDDQHRQVRAGNRLRHVGRQQGRHLAPLEDAARVDSAIAANRLQAFFPARVQPDLEPPPRQVGRGGVAAMPRPHHRYRPDFHAASFADLAFARNCRQAHPPVPPVAVGRLFG